MITTRGEPLPGAKGGGGPRRGRRRTSGQRRRGGGGAVARHSRHPRHPPQRGQSTPRRHRPRRRLRRPGPAGASNNAIICARDVVISRPGPTPPAPLPIPAFRATTADRSDGRTPSGDGDRGIHARATRSQEAPPSVVRQRPVPVGSHAVLALRADGRAVTRGPPVNAGGSANALPVRHQSVLWNSMGPRRTPMRRAALPSSSQRSCLLLAASNGALQPGPEPGRSAIRHPVPPSTVRKST